MLIDPDKMGMSFVKIFALEFLTLGVTGVVIHYILN